MTHFSLCSGIGGLDLAAEWAGFRTVGQSEIDQYACRVLAKNFKGVKNYGDIRTITNERLAGDGIREITVLSAGFPCQPYSLAGKGLGDGDERDLWGEVARVLDEVRPRWFVGENTPGLFARAGQRYFTRILADLNALGYSVSWGIWGACDAGAPHKRDRVFIVANDARERWRELAESQRRQCSFGSLEVREFKEFGQTSACEETRALLRLSRKIDKPSCPVLRNDYGLSEGVDRLRCLGNAVVPQQAYPIFQTIADLENQNILEVQYG